MEQLGRYVADREHYFERPDFPLKIRYDLELGSEQGNHPVHVHEFTELAIVSAGSCLHQTDYGIHPLRAGDVFLVYPEQHHGFRDAKDLLMLNFIFNPQKLPLPYLDFGGHELAARLNKSIKNCTPEDALPFLHLDENRLAAIVAIAMRMREEEKERAPAFYFQTFAWFMQILVLLARSDCQVEARPARFLALPQILEQLEKNYRQPPDLALLARRSGMSQRNFFRRFREATGDTPYHYLKLIRLRHAADFLRHTDWTVEEIACRTGFGSGSALGVEFKRWYHRTPMDFRQSCGL